MGWAAQSPNKTPNGARGLITVHPFRTVSEIKILLYFFILIHSVDIAKLTVGNIVEWMVDITIELIDFQYSKVKYFF